MLSVKRFEPAVEVCNFTIVQHLESDISVDRSKKMCQGSVHTLCHRDTL